MAVGGLGPRVGGTGSCWDDSPTSGTRNWEVRDSICQAGQGRRLWPGFEMPEGQAGGQLGSGGCSEGLTYIWEPWMFGGHSIFSA